VGLAEKASKASSELCVMKLLPRRCRLAAAAAWFVMTPVGAACTPESEPDVATRPVTTAPAVEHAPRSLPRTDERRAERLDMVEWQIARRGIRDEAVLQAMRNVPRHWFVPRSMQPYAYADRALPIGHRQTISQPYIVASMTEALQLASHAKVLEVGTGSGYQAAVLAELTPHVYTVEIVEPLAKRAMEVYQERGYETIEVRVGDGYAGWPEQAPFDAIIVTCAPERVPPALIEQLKPGGRLCIPVGAQRTGQSLRRITKQPDGKLKTENLMPVLFVPMTGDAQKRPTEGDTD
jgi:protein-L-isoaspartate(D-aspartate) O-methyltransferase